MTTEDEPLKLSGWRGKSSGGHLVRRTVAVCVLLSAVVGAVFVLLVAAIGGLRDSLSHARHAQQVLVAANQLELVLVDVQRGHRGFIITGQERFLRPWQAARARFPGRAASLQALATTSGDDQGTRAHQLSAEVASFIEGYSVPLVATARADLAAARAQVATGGGERRLAGLHEHFDRFEAAERQLLAGRQAEADATARQATVAAGAGVAATIVLILLTSGYLAKLVIRPVRHASAMAGRLAAGDLSARMPATGPGEVGALENAFNTMAGSLEVSRDELRRIAAEQAALRRVATLVASGVAPPAVFAAVAAETGGVLAAEYTAVARYEPDGVVVVGSWGRSGAAGQALPLDSHWPVEAGSIPAEVLRTQQSARKPSCERVAGDLAAWAREHGIGFSVGSPVFVDGRLWGVIIAFSGPPGLEPGSAEARMVAFTDLVAMAVANTESRAQLAASRARVVAAADETRRRIERDLHDGIQQRLISLALELRTAAARAPGEQAEVGKQWARAADGLSAVVDELREISRGLHPAILEAGGLGPALRALTRRSGIRTELSVTIDGQLPERVEVAAYYIVSEALTNGTKHAGASRVWVEAGMSQGTLRLLVRDDGRGGADPARGSGLIGLSDRVEALGGRLEIVSPPGGGTSILAMIPAGLT